VWKIEDFLTKWGSATQGKGVDDTIAVILAKVRLRGGGAGLPPGMHRLQAPALVQHMPHRRG